MILIKKEIKKGAFSSRNGKRLVPFNLLAALVERSLYYKLVDAKGVEAYRFDENQRRQRWYKFSTVREACFPLFDSHFSLSILLSLLLVRPSLVL